MVTVVTLVNQKGGTGKTTLSAILAYGLSSLGHNVLLIDLDPQAHLTSFFLKGEELDKYPGSIHMAKDERFKTISIHKIKGKGKISLVPSNLRYVIWAYKGEIPSQDNFAIDRRIMKEPIIKNYSYVICDTPPEVFAPTLWALYAAHYLIIPTNLEELSIAGIKLLIKDVLPDIIPYNRHDVKVLGVVLTNITKRWSKQTILKIEEKLRRFIKKNVPRPFHERFYSKIFFDTIIYRYGELKDLVYTPGRYNIPLFRIMDKNDEIKNIAIKFAQEVLARVQYFQPLT